MLLSGKALGIMLGGQGPRALTRKYSGDFLMLVSGDPGVTHNFCETIQMRIAQTNRTIFCQIAAAQTCQFLYKVAREVIRMWRCVIIR